MTPHQPGSLACRELVELITAYVEGVLPPHLHAAVREHLADCVECTTYVEQIRVTTGLAGQLADQLVDQLADDDLPAELQLRLRAALRPL